MALLVDNDIWIARTLLFTTLSFTLALPWESKAGETTFDRDCLCGFTGLALDVDGYGFRGDGRGTNDDTRYADKMRDIRRVEITD